MMNVWWLALDTDYTSYEQLKDRKVIAQGWPQIGDLRTLCKLATNRHKHLFKDVIRELALIAYGEGNRDVKRAPEVMWYLFQVRRGDLVVGIEGTTVRGICQAQQDAAESYRYEDSGEYIYAQTICSPTDWIDWEHSSFGTPPCAPAQSVMGIKRLQQDRTQVIRAWERFANSIRPGGSDGNPGAL